MKFNRAKLFETKRFGLIIGAVIIVLFLLINSYTTIIDNIEIKILDIHFRLKDITQRDRLQEGVSIAATDPNISEDILIIGIDFRALSQFGRWPFPRYLHSYLIDNLTYIQNQDLRERVLFLDIFFNEPSEKPIDDVVLINSIYNNNRVFLETILDETTPDAETHAELLKRQDILYQQYGEITTVSGDWKNMRGMPGIQPPLQPYARAAKGYGHANYFTDQDEVFRRQPLIIKSYQVKEEYRLDQLIYESIQIDESNFERLGWTDRNGHVHTIPYPLTEQVINNLEREMQANASLRRLDTSGDGKIDTEYYVVRKYKDYFVPSITLSMALEYFNKNPEDIEVVIGDYIRIPDPEYFDIPPNQQYNLETDEWLPIADWVPYTKQITPPSISEDGTVVEEAKHEVVPEIVIPIDKNGNMLINYMGPPSFATPGERQTFPVRSYSGYATTPRGPDPNQWRRTMGLQNKLVMVGAFERGIADDHKPTPYGLMYGVEIHANALNTIIMDNFVRNIPWWADILIFIVMALFIAFITSRFSTIWAFVATMVLIFVLFLSSSIIFDSNAYIVNFSMPAIATFFIFLAIVVYRVMTEERDKRRIRNMFGTYVSPKVVDQILENPPELGGVDKELTVFFSDIRGFTTLSESMTPQELVKILNRYLTAMTDIILDCEGTLDKYEGDAIMCFWGAPVSQEDHAYRACKAAVLQMRALKILNEELPKEKQFDIGIGINSGIMTVGNMGSLQRMDYTLIGDNVNLGARLEGINKQYLTNIIISEYTYGLVKDSIIARELDNIRVKGKNKPVLIYELIDYIEKPDEVDADKDK